MCINDAPQTPGVHLACFADGTCLHAKDHEEGFVIRKLQRGLSSMRMWCERWNMKINEEQTLAIYFLVDTDRLSLILHSMNGTFHS
jgi:hypothetical protein